MRQAHLTKRQGKHLELEPLRSKTYTYVGSERQCKKEAKKKMKSQHAIAKEKRGRAGEKKKKNK